MKMKTHVIYLYRTMNSHLTKNDKHVFQLLHSPLIALIDSDDPFELSRQQKIIDYKLIPFEISQKLYDYTVRTSDRYKMRIIDIEFVTDIDNELNTQLRYAIKNNDISKLLNVITVVRSENTDINSLTFKYINREYRVTKFGIVEIDAELDELEDLTVNSPVSILTGLKKTL